MHDLAPFAKAARAADLLPPGEYEPLSIFPPNYEPEAKIDLGNRHSKLLLIRQKLAEGFGTTKTSVLRESINPGGHAVINMIVEPYSDDGKIPRFCRDGKFMRIAGRVDENGKLYEVKIALKSLSSRVEVIDGLPYRQEFDRKLPSGISLEDGFRYWQELYANEYRTNRYNDITFDQLRPTSAYMSARTGFMFLNELKEQKLTLVNEACEDLYLPVGPDFCTDMGPVRDCEAQFEWETIGALITPGQTRLNQQEKTELGLFSMQKLLRGLIHEIYTGPYWETHTVVDSKAEVSRHRTLAHPNYIWVHNGDAVTDAYNQISGTGAEAYISLLENQRNVGELLADPDVRNHLCRFARIMERARIDYNSKAPKSLMFDQTRTLDA